MTTPKTTPAPTPQAAATPEAASTPPAAATPETKHEAARLHEAIEAFYFAFRAFTARPDAMLERLGLGRVHHRILYFVARRPEQRVSELLATLGISKQALHGPLRQLGEAGLIEAKVDVEDRRGRRLRLTARGQALEAELSATQREILAWVFARSGPAAEAGWREVMAALATRLPDKTGASQPAAPIATGD